MDWITAVAKAVAEGETGHQFAIPRGVHTGDMFFITDDKHAILIIFHWNGDKWEHQGDGPQ